MEGRRFAQSLSDLLFEKVSSGGPGARGGGQALDALGRCVLSLQLGGGPDLEGTSQPLVLNSVLSKALQYSLHGDSRTLPTSPSPSSSCRDVCPQRPGRAELPGAPGTRSAAPPGRGPGEGGPKMQLY